jgi:Tol biopolymer transport system component
MVRTCIRWRWTAWVAVAALGAGTAVAGKPGGGSPPPSGPPAIAYYEGNSLKTMAADGSGQTTVILDAAYALNASCCWSPDGAQIAFQGYVDGTGLYVVNRDGTGIVKLCSDFATDPAWSPPTDPAVPEKVAYKAGADIWLVNPDGTVRQNLTSPATRTESYPTWSPDGRRLAVRFNDAVGGVVTEAGLEIYDLAFDSAGAAYIVSVQTVVRDTANPSGVGFLWMEWSRGGDRIAYADYDESTGRYDLWVMKLSDPDHPIRVTQTSNADEREPSWTPDDKALVFERFGYKGFRGSQGLVQMDLATGQVTSLNAANGRFPNRAR